MTLKFSSLVVFIVTVIVQLSLVDVRIFFLLHHFYVSCSANN